MCYMQHKVIKKKVLHSAVSREERFVEFESLRTFTFIRSFRAAISIKVQQFL
jgi:hypothetical protein